MKSAIAIAAHPDDIEFLMAGTLIRLGAAGYQLHYLTLADGCCGTTQYDRATIAAMRRRESQRAAEMLGAAYHESLCHDLEILYDRPTLRRLASIIRRVAPEIVLTHSPSDYMEDHMITCRLAVTAVFARGMPNFPAAPPRPAVTEPAAVYHAQPYSNRDPLGRLVRPALFVDATDLQDRKAALLACHESQKQWLDESQGLDSYLLTLRALDAEVGQLSGRWAFAEGWRRHLHLGFSAAGFDPLRAALDPWVHEGPP